MQKVIIIGCPGSGKSTFGKKLNKVTGLPLYHLDMMYWNEDKTTVGKDIFLSKLQEVLSSPNWIIDGNYGSTMEMRLRECDTVFFLDYPTEICLEGVRERRGKPRSDMPWFEGDSVDEEFISFIENFQKESRPNILELLKKYSNKDIIVFHSRKESQEYLNSKLKLKEITDPSKLTNAYGIYKHCMFEPTMEKFCRKMTEYLQDENVKIYACLCQGEIKGITVISLAESKSEILGIAVDENIRNCGIGTYMVNEIVKLHNIPFIYAETDDDAVGFYQKNNFSITQFTECYNEVQVRRYKCDLNTKKEKNYD